MVYTTDGDFYIKNQEKIRRSYPGGLIDEQLQRVKGKSREELLRPKGIDNKSVGVPFVLTYHPRLNPIQDGPFRGCS